LQQTPKNRSVCINISLLASIHNIKLDTDRTHVRTTSEYHPGKKVLLVSGAGDVRLTTVVMVRSLMFTGNGAAGTTRRGIGLRATS